MTGFVKVVIDLYFLLTVSFCIRFKGFLLRLCIYIHVVGSLIQLVLIVMYHVYRLVELLPTTIPF